TGSATEALNYTVSQSAGLDTAITTFSDSGSQSWTLSWAGSGSGLMFTVTTFNYSESAGYSWHTHTDHPNTGAFQDDHGSRTMSLTQTGSGRTSTYTGSNIWEDHV